MTPDSERVTVACAANADFAVPLAVTVASLLANLSPDRSVELWVVDAGMGAEARARLRRSWPRRSLRLRWVRADPDLLPDLPLWGRMGPETYLRLAVGELLPSRVRKVIWLDCDLVVLGDLAELWDHPLDGAGLLAAQDLVVPYVSSPLGVSAFRELGLLPETKYFNAGVMVIDLEWWRRHDISRRVVDYLQRHHDTAALWDQEGLNAVLAGAWAELDPRWNQIASVSGRRFFKAPHLSPEAYRSVVEDPLIIHFAGSLKPWLHHLPDPARDLFFRYVDTTAWAGWRPRLGVRSVLLGLAASRLRNLLHPLERPLLGLASRWRRTGTRPAGRI